MNALADWAVGQVYAALESNGILDDTLLIFTSDNGPQKGENGQQSAGPLRGLKNTPFEGGHRIPFVARWPERISAGVTNTCVFSLTDLMATFADLLEFQIPEEAAPDSISFLPALLGDAGFKPRHAMVNTTGCFWAGDADFALRKDNWKLIVRCERKDAPAETFLFNLKDDLGENQNLIDNHPEIAAKLKMLLNRVQACGTKYLEWK